MGFFLVDMQDINKMLTLIAIANEWIVEDKGEWYKPAQYFCNPVISPRTYWFI